MQKKKSMMQFLFLFGYLIIIETNNHLHEISIIVVVAIPSSPVHSLV